MCGIFCSLSRSHHVSPSDQLASHLRSRGPDSQVEAKLNCRPSTVDSIGHAANDVFVTLYSTVLSLRGDTTVRQPYQDEDANYTLCWNGEAWNIGDEPVRGNDTEMIHSLLVDALQTTLPEDSSYEAGNSAYKISRALSTVAGTYAFLFLDCVHKMLFFGRDFLGRRSLLTTTTPTGDILISSVPDASDGLKWTELEATGVHYIEFAGHDDGPPSSEHPEIYSVPYYFSSVAATSDPLTHSVIPRLSLNKDIPQTAAPLNEHSTSVTALEALLLKSLSYRVINIPRPPASQDSENVVDRAKLAILFSGGLDCTTLARLSHVLLPTSDPIDLLNVAFQNPRIHKNVIGDSTNFYELCPDRMTGRASFAELQRICPIRTWNFVAINIPYDEVLNHRELIISLMHPHNTEMDLSIAGALYFASRGEGYLSESPIFAPVPYKTNARVLLSGLGADEIFAGYTRHATAYRRGGFGALIEELNLDVARLGSRNLGRDDRVMSHWSKEVRYPFLDERLLSWALKARVNEKCGFGEPEDAQSSSDGSTALEPGKKVLRCLAWKLGMTNVAREKKRAIQFGARTAKMETGKTKGTTPLS